jgi:hypothetical protein
MLLALLRVETDHDVERTREPLLAVLETLRCHAPYAFAEQLRGAPGLDR